MKIYEFGKKKPHLRSSLTLGYIPNMGFTALGPRRRVHAVFGHHQTHPGDSGCNMNRQINLWRPEDLEKA